jgi:anti-repressor protein
MKELIKITKNFGNSIVSARDLHKFLISESDGNLVGRDFSNWIKDKLDFGYILNVDYSVLKFDHKGNVIPLPNNGETDTKRVKVHKIEYALTLEMAKEIAMLQKNDKGREARLYFIECEKQLLQNTKVPNNFREALLLAADQQLQIEQNQILLNERELKIKEDKPKVEFFDQVTGSSDCFDMADVAKICNMGIGRNRLFELLRNSKVLKSNNVPYQNYIDLGFFRVIESSFTRPDGSVSIYLKTMVFQKGIDYLIKKYKR